MSAEKEKLSQSGRVKIALAGFMAEVLILIAAHYQLEVPPDVLNNVALGISGIVMSLVLGRSYRNVPASTVTAEQVYEADIQPVE